MKELSDLNLPEDLRYTQEHEWISSDRELCKIGITDFAQDQLGDVVFIELPDTGVKFAQGEEFVVLESVKAVSEVYMPVAGEIIQVNSQLVDSPELINANPYEGGWLVEIKISDPNQLKETMDREQYYRMLQGGQ